MNYFVLFLLFFIPIILKEHEAVLGFILAMGFCFIVINSKKYPKINNLIDKIF